MEGDTAVVVIDLDRPRSEGDSDLLARIGVGNGVKMAVVAELDMVVEPDGRRLEVRVLVADLRKGLQGRLVDRFEEFRS